ncbi:peptide chain release factor N(5)-glutamine methyltransferase [Actinokineospora cianjurensis]|uniref:Release factor glutamine methyltransferase n=1 Tax=Actinokineospora cianjurensis TaxID=585224 RepID=A0A421BA27_9PSEU|nr:peptide chain release factor N(5)-glutamine methyltransferase [Actinokineospora cianjurensis]RLK61396.1 release factor glutamine methyltransferase [Actinokineospora cianjurensis]
MRHPLRLAIRDAERILTAAGVDSPRTDAELLAAHVLAVPRGQLVMIPLVSSGEVDQLAGLVRRRAAREPLQHLTGSVAMGSVEVSVGPGVFVPRPETELLLEWGLAALSDVDSPVVVDLCAGSGVLALAVAAARPDAVVHAVELDSSALAWARRNSDARVSAGDRPIRLHHGDVTDPALLSEMDGQVDLVLCNPPYVPEGTPVPPEVSGFDPARAVFSGADGLTVIRSVVSLAARLLKPGGSVAIEHDDSQGESVPALLRARRVLSDVDARLDLAGRPRFATAVRVVS